MEIFIDLTESELDIAKAYAKLKDLSLEDCFKIALFERIEAERNTYNLSE